MGSNPKFLVKNLITSTSMIAVSSGSTNVIRLIDRNNEIAWSTVSETSGTRTITITFSGATPITRIFVQGVNWKAFTIKYNTGTDFSTPIVDTDNTDTNLYWEFNSVSATTVEIAVTDTITASQNVTCAELYIGTEIFEMASNTAGIYRVNAGAAQRIIELSDGTSYKVFIRRVTGFNIDFTAVSATEKANYLSLYNRNRREPFVFIPYPLTASWDGLAYHVNWVNEFDLQNFAQDLRDNPYIGTMQLRQASGI